MICDVAYFCRSGAASVPVTSVDDWLTAEAEVDRALTLSITANRQVDKGGAVA